MNINGKLFRARADKKENQPDFSGSYKDENDKEMDVAVWVNTSEKAGKYYSFTVRDHKDFGSKPAAATSGDAPSDDLGI